MRILIALLALALLFGCTGGEQKPAENATNQSVQNQTNNTPINVIIGEQQNQTTVKNHTEEPPPPPPPVKEGLEYDYNPDALFGVFFIDVGGPELHGDAILIKKGDMDVLVDAGPAENANKVVDFLRSHGVDDLEVLISTNADPRHYGGLEAVAQNFPIEEFWWSGDTFDDTAYAGVVDDIQAKSWKTVEVSDGYSEDLNGMNFTVINPPQSLRFEDTNNDAIVTRVVDRNFSMLLTSGIQTGAQGRLINQHPAEIQDEIMQAPYYGVGSGTSNIGVFLITAKPKTIIVSGSSDESPPNGGSREPFQRLMAQYGIEWHANYVNGTIRIASDGDNYTISALGKG
jgi:competence protein ComEC